MPRSFGRSLGHFKRNLKEYFRIDRNLSFMK